MADQAVPYNTTTNLAENTFTSNMPSGSDRCGQWGYRFSEWNTEPNGTGTAYPDKASIYIENGREPITLYAQWKTYIYGCT